MLLSKGIYGIKRPHKSQPLFSIGLKFVNSHTFRHIVLGVLRDKTVGNVEVKPKVCLIPAQNATYPSEIGFKVYLYWSTTL
jgi:hypothetical protein